MTTDQNPDRWFAAITTAPRKQPTCQQTVDSLRAAHFLPRVYAEPGSPVVNASTITHEQKLGVWFNWVFAVRRALQSNRELCLIVQDDIEIHPETMSVIEYIFDNQVIQKGPLSVYTPRGYSYENNDIRYARRKPGIYPIVSDKLWGAVGFAYRREDLLQIAHHPLIESWRGFKPAPNKQDAVNSDVAIGRICKSLGMKAWFPTPSFGVHTSRFSSIPGHGSNDVKRNRNAESPAAFGRSLADQLFGRSQTVGQ